MAKNFNVIISGWPGCGSSTNAKIASFIFQMKYFYVGGLTRYVASLMGYGEKDRDLVVWNEKYLESWDKLWEEYIIENIMNFENTIFDSKILGFFVKSSKFKKIFITANLDVRLSRLKHDKRADTLLKRDAILKEKWKNAYDIDFFDRTFIASNYDIVLDTSNMDIYKAALSVCEFIKDDKLNDIEIKQIKYLADHYFTNPDLLPSKLKENKLIYDYVEILKDIKKKMQKVLKKTNFELAKTINNISDNG